MKTRIKMNVLIHSVTLAVVLFTGIVVQAESGEKIKPINEAALNKLISANDTFLVLSFMAAWCGPCIDELPVLNRLHKKYKNQNFKIIGISIDFGGPGAMAPILKKMNIKFPVYWCGEKGIRKFNLNAIPMLLFIRRGASVERIHGKRTEKFLDQKIQEFLRL
ncbi:MAG: TlpA disulfide reductase family protein [Desulfobacterales bacterium]|jgi:thiol-disulfide isomerase/thioredoxin